MPATRNQALSTIILRSKEASESAVKALRATSEKGAQLNYNQAAQIALVDPETNFTEIERALISSYIKEPEEINRCFTIRFRVSGEELDQIKKDAYESRSTLSEYIRSKLISK